MTSSDNLETNFVFYKQPNNTEILKISKDGFWVRGIKVEQGPGEAELVYKTLKEFLRIK